MNRKLGIGLFALFLAVSFLSLSSAYMVENNVYVGTQSTTPTFVADGQTTYRMDVVIDNRGLHGESSSGIQWQLTFPSYIEVTSYSIPSQQSDFFAGYSTAFQQININQPSARQMWSGPSNREGRVISYFFKVKADAPIGGFTPLLDNVDVIDGSMSNTQPVYVHSETFKIVKPFKTDKPTGITGRTTHSVSVN